jgi:signal transduction histidine kinase
MEELSRCSPVVLYRGRQTDQGDFLRDFLTPNTEAVVGWSREALNDPELFWELLSEEDRLVRNRSHARAARDGRSLAEYRCQRPDGSFVWLRNEAVAVGQLPDGSVELVGAIVNITREREIGIYAAMQNRLASLGEISASLAHELNQPMTVIGIAASLAERLSEDQPRRADLLRHLKTIADQTQRAGDIIRHLRAYSRMDGGSLADIALGDAIRSAVALVGNALEEAAVKVSVEVEADLPMVRARQVQVEQILVNLLVNARDAMAATPAAARRVIVRAMKHGPSVQIEVEDTGPGVPVSLLGRLFEPFFTTKAQGHGTGLGLSLCQSMMQQFSGSISASNGRHGAVFTLQFPLDVATRQE